MSSVQPPTGPNPSGSNPSGEDPFGPSDPFDPSDPFLAGADRPPRPPGPWYRRWPALIAALILIGIAASVVSDLPRGSTPTDHAVMLGGAIKGLNTDTHACAYATTQAFSIYRRLGKGTFPSNDRTLVPKYLADDQQACSYEDQSIYSISTITVPNVPGGADVSSAITAALKWATSDAVGAIIDIETLVKHPGNAAASHDLAKREKLLATDRARCEHRLHAASVAVGAGTLPALGLPKLPTPT